MLLSTRDLRGRIVAALGAGLVWLSLRCLADEPATPAAEAPTNRVERITALRLEDILNVQVTTASRTPAKWFESPSAAYVITSEDIQRSGARTIADALRMAPGISVARLDANKWAVASRGFNDRYTPFLLVMIDGRTMYEP